MPDSQDPLKPVAAHKRRPIRSYVIRAGRFTESQRRAIAAHWQDYVVEWTPGDDLRTVFSQAQPLTVEIGFGMGDSLLQMAIANPGQNFLGIEVHKPGIGKLLNGLAEHQLDNVRIVCGDATEVIASGLPVASVARFLILFPDPWPKKKHHKRRIVQAPFVNVLAERLEAGGGLHLATDWEPYAEHMLAVLEDCVQLCNAHGPGAYWQNPDRPATKFERRGRRLGHGVRDLLYRRQPDQQ